MLQVLPGGRLLIRRLLLLLVFSFLVVASASAADVRFQTGKVAFEHGEFAAAYKIFQQLLQQQPGNPEIDFLLGRSAFELGDYEAAIFAFERVLIADPSADRVRLELGRSYFEIGDLEAARSQFNRVLKNRPPPVVRQNIERYLEQLEKVARKHSLSGSLTLSLSYDDNVYASPVDEQIGTVLGNVTLTGSGATPQDDLINRNSLQVNHLYRNHPKEVGWLSTLQAHSALYGAEDNLNLTLLGVSSGPLWQQGKQFTKVQFNASYLTLDQERYLSLAGLSAEHSRSLGDKLTLTLATQLTRLDYASSGRDANQYRVELKPGWTLKNGSLLAGVAVEGNSAKQDEYSYFRTMLQMRYQRSLPWQVTGLIGVRLQQTDYDGVIALFNRARKDWLRELSIGLSRPVWQDIATGRRVQAQLLGTFTKVNSNIDLYEYDKQVFSFALSYLF